MTDDYMILQFSTIQILNNPLSLDSAEVTSFINDLMSQSIVEM